MTKEKEQKNYGLLFFWAVFLSMCMFRLWFTLLLVVLFAIGMTFKQKKRGYCNNVCPVGFIQDELFSKDQPLEKRKMPNSDFWRKVLFVVFWGYIFIYIVLLYDQTQVLWIKMIQLMLFSALAAALLQHRYRKRFWCSRLCPVGSVLNRVIKLS